MTPLQAARMGDPVKGARLNAACGGVSGHATPVNQLSLSSTTQKRVHGKFQLTFGGQRQPTGPHFTGDLVRPGWMVEGCFGHHEQAAVCLG